MLVCLYTSMHVCMYTESERASGLARERKRERERERETERKKTREEHKSKQQHTQRKWCRERAEGRERPRGSSDSMPGWLRPMEKEQYSENFQAVAIHYHRHMSLWGDRVFGPGISRLMPASRKP